MDFDPNRVSDLVDIGDGPETLVTRGETTHARTPHATPTPGTPYATLGQLWLRHNTPHATSSGKKHATFANLVIPAEFEPFLLKFCHFFGQL